LTSIECLKVVGYGERAKSLLYNPLAKGKGRRVPVAVAGSLKSKHLIAKNLITNDERRTTKSWIVIKRIDEEGEGGDIKKVPPERRDFLYLISGN
jgi:hypothetical protein